MFAVLVDFKYWLAGVSPLNFLLPGEIPVVCLGLGVIHSEKTVGSIVLRSGKQIW